MRAVGKRHRRNAMSRIKVASFGPVSFRVTGALFAGIVDDSKVSVEPGKASRRVARLPANWRRGPYASLAAFAN
jgi:hypothetical protein